MITYLSIQMLTQSSNDICMYISVKYSWILRVWVRERLVVLCDLYNNYRETKIIHEINSKDLIFQMPVRIFSVTCRLR